MFFKSKWVFNNIVELTQKVAEYEKDNVMRLLIKHSVPNRSFQEYICNSHDD
jgi:hypothetical protein